MTKFHTKLLVFMSVLFCSLCLILGITACNGGGHTHTFGGFWLYDGEDGHYRLATCHPEVKSKLEPHVDKNGDFNCDVCGYLMHVHVDEDGDNFCDDCHSVIHKHTFDEGWTFNENMHWHKATCEHFIERSGFIIHRFTEGVCECGVKESEVKVYGLYKNSPEYELYFTEWLAWLKAEGITVEYTESGDGIYHYEDHSEVRFLGERTVKVQAVSDGEPLSDVWFMVTLYTNNEYHQNNGTIALGIAKTDSTGIAEIPFSPVGGYSAQNVQYRIRLALSADVAIALGTSEENANPIPNRYVANNAKEYYSYEVSENSNAEDIAVTVSFTFSKGWNAYDKIELPYKRYYQDLINGNGIKEEGATYNFTTSGDNLFDYFLFEPAKYSFAKGETVEDFAKIEENAKIAASGIYKICFTVEGNANVTLYYWNEQGVNLGAYHVTKSDGTPSDDYITSISGGTAGNGKYTGGNFVEVVIKPENGLREYQFGIISDNSAKITFTVERTGDYVVDSSLCQLSVGVASQKVDFTGYDITPFALVNVPEGLYSLTVIPSGSPTEVGMLAAYIVESDKALLWENNQYKGIIRISAGAEVLYIDNGGKEFKGTVLLEEYKIPELGAGKEAYLPASGSVDNAFEINLSKSVPAGACLAEITLYGSRVAGNSYTVTLIVGEREYVFSTTRWPQQEVTYSDYIQVLPGETIKIISNNRGSYSTLIVKAKLTTFPSVQQDTVTNINYTTTSSLDNVVYYAFTATKAGTFRLTLDLLSEATKATDLYYMLVDNAYDSEQVIIKNGVRENDALITTTSGTFELEEGESILLKFTRKRLAPMNLNFIIEYVKN
ncbi:MAG: hypothetical protein J1F61_06445 [Clostridiales bacterium]|nr:hypothetical protein [Clostridiales bacterium]